MFHFRNRLACSSCLTAAVATLSAGVAAAGEVRDPWKNLRGDDQGPKAVPAERSPQAASTNVLDTADATYTVGQQDLNDNLDVLLDRSYGATPARERDFIPGIDGLAGGKKWRPHVEFSVAPGNNRTMGQVNLFAPLMQDSDSLFYADLRASAWTTDVQEGNFGVGYRQIVPGAFFGSDAILGVYGFVDARHSEYNNMFYQGSLGAELITERFEFRVNGYLPSGSQYVVGTAPGGGVTLNGRDVVYSNGNLVERALPGFDVEAGVKIDFSEAAIRLNAGYFRFERGDTLVEGPRFRAEVEIDDPFGWDGAKLSIGGEIRDDKVRGTEASGLVRLRVPIGGPSKSELADRQLSDLEKLMTRRINRDEDVVAPIVQKGNAAGTGAATDALSGETLQAFFVANTAQGAADCSSVANACDFATAQGLAGAGDTFLPIDIAGVIGSVFTLNGDRQQVIGAGGSGQAIVQLSDGSGSTLIIGSLGGRPIMTGVNMGHFADTRVSGIATNGAAGISGSGMTGTIRVNDVVLNNGGLDFGSSGAAINVSGATISSGTEDGIRLDHITGSATFADTRISTTSGDGVRMSASGGASVTFANGLDIDTTTGTGLSASGGGTLSVGASGADESITSTAGQAVAMNGVDIGAAGMTFDSITSTGSASMGIAVTGAGGGTFAVSGATTISGSTGSGINLSGNSAMFNFSGATSITMTSAAAGVRVSGVTGGTVLLADLDIALQAAGATGLDLSGATLNANLTATDFDLTSTSAVGTTGVNLSGTMGAGIIRLGDIDANGASATIAGVDTGIQFSAGTNATFIFGDGEAGTDKGSSISANTAIAGGSIVTLGSYDFDDVNFTGTLDFASAGTQNLVFVASAATGDGSGSSVNNLANAVTADAIAANNTTFVLVNDGAAIDDVDGFTLADGQTMASFGNGRTFTATGLLIPANFSGVPGAGTTIIDPTGNGAATLTNSGAGDTLTASGTVNLQDFILSNTAGGDGLTASGATTITATGITIQNVAGQGIDLDNLTGPASTFDNTVVSTTTGNGVDIVNSNVNFTGGLDIDTTSGTGFSATGGGTVSVVAGALPNTVTSTAGQAIAIDGISGNLSFNTLSSTGSVTEGVAIANFGAGSSFSVSGATTVNTAAGDGILINTIAGSITFGGPVAISSAGDEGIDIKDSPNGTIVFQDSVTIADAGGVGVQVDGVAAGPAATGTITFAGLVDVDRSGDSGISIFDRTGAIGFAHVDIDTAGNGGLFLNGAQLDGTLTFGQLDVNVGPGSFVALQIDNGSTGTIDINGGTIENTGGNAMVLTGSNVTLTYTGTMRQATANEELLLVTSADTSNVTFESGSVLQATNGSGLIFQNAQGIYTFNGTTTLNGGTARVGILGSAGTFHFGANTAIISPATAAFNVGSGTATVTYNGTINQNAGSPAVLLQGNTGGSVTFGGMVTVSSAAIPGVFLTNNAGASIAFNGGLDITTATATGFSATGGGTIAVAATAGDESINSSFGQAINLNGVTIGAGGVNLDSVSSSSAAGSAIAFTNVAGGAFAVSGTTNINLGTGVGAAGIDFAGNNTGTFSFGATTITDVGAAANQTGIDFSGATLGGAVNFASVAISGPDTSTSSIGVNLTGVLGGQIVNLGSQVNPATGPSSSITDLHRGVVIDNTAAVQFTFGDGESVSDRGSSINVNGQAGAFTVDAAGGTLGGSSFDFNDVTFGAGDTANLPTSSAPVFVSAAGGVVSAGVNNLNQDVTTITVSAAEALADTDQTFVFVGGAGGTLDLTGGGLDGFTLDAGQSVVSFNDGNAISLGVTQPVNLEGNFNITGVTSDNVIVSNSAGGATSVINASAGGGNTIANFDVSTGATGILINGNTATVTVTNVGITGVAGAGTGVSVQGAQAAVGLNDVDISGTTGGIDNRVGAATGDVTIDAASSITDTALVAVFLDNNASDFGFAGTVSENDGAGNGIFLNSVTGAVSFSGSVTLNTGVATAVSMAASAGSLSFSDVLNIDTTSGTGFTAAGGGTVSVAATAGDQSISTASGQALNLNAMTIGAGGLNFDTVQVSTGGAADGIGIDTVDTAAGGIVIGSATLAGHTGTAIDLDGISGAGGFSLVSADIDLGGALAVGLDIGGANGTISIGTGTSNAVMGLNIDGGQTGIRIGQTAGTVNLGTSATGVVQIGATSRPTEQALRINVDSAGTINVGNTTNQSRLDANLNGIFSAFADAATTFTNLRTGSSASVTVLINDNDAAGETNFVGGLQVESTGGGGIALNTTQVSVASAPGLNSLTASGNVIGLNLNGTTIGAAGLHFDTVTLAGTATGINISGGVTGGDIVLGDVDINPTAGAGVTRAISISGGLTNLTIADFDATLQQDDIGLQVTGALGGTISFGDFDIVSASAIGTVGVDIAGATGGTIQVGDTNTNGGENVTLGSGANTLAIGVRVDGTTNTTFTIGDGDGTTGDLTASDIHATQAISGALPANGTYNFRDVEFNASGVANISGGASFFVFDETGTSGAGTFADPGTAAEAMAAGVNVLVAIDNSGAIGNVIDLSSAGQGSINTLSLDDNQALISLINGQSIDVSTLISGLSAAAPANFQFTNVGGTTTITGSGVAGGGLATITTTGANNTVSLAGSAGIQSVNITNGGTGDAIFASYGAGENVIIRSSTITGGTGGDSIDIAATAGASTFDFSILTLTGGLRLDGSGAGTFTGAFGGTNTIDGSATDGIRITNVSATISGVTFGATSAITGAGIRIDNTDGTSRTVNLLNNTMGSGGNGDTADVGGIGIDINSSGAGVLTVNLVEAIGANVIRSTGQALDVDETRGGGGVANNVLLTVSGTTFESVAVGVPSVEVTGQNVSTTTNSVGVRGFANNTVIGNGTAGGILFTAVDFDSDGTDAQVAGGTLNIGQGTGNRVQGDGLSFIDTTGDLSFTTLNIFNNGGTGLEVDTKTNGNNTIFNLANGGGSVDTTNGTALFLDPLTMNLVFTAVNSTGANGAGGLGSGVFIQQGDASGGAAGVALDIGTLSIEDSTGAGLVIEDSTGTFNFGATTIDNTATAGGGVYIDATGGDTLNVNFTGGLDIDTASGTGFDAIASIFNLEIVNAGTETIDTTTGRVLNLRNTNAAGAGINFDSLTATGTVGDDVVYLEMESGTFNGGDVIIAGTAGINDNGIQIIQGDGAASVNFASATIDNVAGTAIVSSFAGTATFTTVNIDGGRSAVVHTGNGTLNIDGGSIGASTSTSSRSIFLQSGAGNVNIAATVTKSTAGELVRISGRSGGTVTLSGNLTATGAATGIYMENNTGGTITFSGTTKTLNTGANAAVSLINNTGATVDFTGGGLDIDTTSGTGFTATGGGTVNVTTGGAANTIASTGGAAVDMQNVTMGASGATFASISSGGGTNGILLQHVDGAFTVTGTAALNNSASAGLNLFNSNVGNDGNLTFTANTLNISNASGGGAFVQRGTGTGRTDFDVTTGTINSGSRTPIFISNSGNATIDLGATFASVSMNGSANGIFIQNNLATGTISGSLNTGTGGTIQNTGANAVNMNRLSANVTIGQAITTASGGIRVTNQVSGTNTFSGVHNLTGAGSGYLFDSNAGGATNITGNVTASTLNGAALTINTSAAHAVTFSGTNTVLSTTTGNTVDISGGATVNFNSSGTNTITATGTGKGIEANGGGTVVIGGTASVTSATGTAVDIQNTTIGAGGVTFRSVSSNGAVNGIVLNNTGALGGLTINGDGSTPAGRGGNNSGGQILNSTGSGIVLTDTSNVSLAHMNITGAADHGIDALRVSGFAGAYLTLDSNGNANQEHGIRIRDAAGVYDFTKLSADGNFDAHVRVLQQTGSNSLTSFTVNDSLFQNVTTGTFEDGILFEMQTGTSVGTLTIQNSNFNNHDGDHVQVALNGSASITTTTINNNAMTATGTNLGGGLTVNHAGTYTGSHAVNITNNNIQGANVQSINVNLGGHQAAATVNTTITGNTIGTAGVAGSGGFVGIEVEANGLVGSPGGTMTALIDNNVIREYTDIGISIGAVDGAGTTATLNSTITNNIVTESLAGAAGFAAIFVDIQNDNIACADIRNNTLSGTGFASDVSFRTSSGGTLSLENYVGAGNDQAAINAYLTGNNTMNAGIHQFNVGSNAQGGGACPVP